MLNKLKQRWKVNSVDLFLILCVFAITGTSTAYIANVVTGWVGLTKTSPLWQRASLRGFVFIFGYQAILLSVSIPFGQFRFFWNYEKKILRRMGLMKPEPKQEKKS